MLYSALHLVTQELNRFLMQRFQTQDTKAILGNILDEAGTIPEGNQNKIILSVVNMEQETGLRNTTASQKTVGTQPFNFNIDVLTTALFDNYDEGLKFLSETLYFFNAKSIFSHENTPGMDSQIQRIIIEPVKLSYSELQHLWTALGTRYQPSALFKLRMLSFQNDQIITPIITDHPKI